MWTRNLCTSFLSFQHWRTKKKKLGLQQQIGIDTQLRRQNGGRQEDIVRVSRQKKKVKKKMGADRLDDRNKSREVCGI